MTNQPMIPPPTNRAASPEDLRRLAVRARRLARELLTDPSAPRLEDFAGELEAEAAQLEAAAYRATVLASS